MAGQFTFTHTRAVLRAAVPPPHDPKSESPLSISTIKPTELFKRARKASPGVLKSWRIHVSSGGDSYLDMWKRAAERERQSKQFEKVAENLAGAGDGDEEAAEEVEVLSEEEWERKSREFQKILEVPTEERDRVQRMQVVDRAAAAIAAAKTLLKENVEAENGGAKGVDGNGGDFDLI